MKEKIKIQNKGGRKPKVNYKTNRYVFRLTDEENAKFLALFDQSGMDNKAEFVISMLFEKEIKRLKSTKEQLIFTCA